MISAGELRNGVTMEYKGKKFTAYWNQHAQNPVKVRLSFVQD